MHACVCVANVLVKRQPVCNNHQAWFWQNATGLLVLPVSHFQTHLHSSIDGLEHTEQKQPGSSWVLADCVRFWPYGSGLDTS